MCLDCDFAIGAEDVKGISDIFLDILDKLLDGFAKNRALLWSQRIGIGCWEACDLGCALVLLALAILCQLYGTKDFWRKVELGTTHQSALCCLYSMRPILISLKSEIEETRFPTLKETSRGVS